MVKKLSGERTGRGHELLYVWGRNGQTQGPLIIVGAVSVWGLEGTWKLIPLGYWLPLFFT